MSLALVRTRNEAMDFLEGYSLERKDELDQRQVSGGLVKSYMLETVPCDSAQPDLGSVFGSVAARLDPVDDTLAKIWDARQGKYIALLEQLLPRHPVIYTNEKAELMDRWCRDLIHATPLLDRLWISGWMFERLWDKVVQINSGRRYGRLAFEHQSIFDIDAEEINESEEDVDSDTEVLSEEARTDQASLVQERRTTRFTVVDRIEVLNDRLPHLRKIYGPLCSISQLRFPAAGRGGHDFYHNGKVTNRSDSFADHRAHLAYVLRIYKKATEMAEQAAWYSRERVTLADSGGLTRFRGAPVIMEFEKALTQEVFDRWIASTFRRKHNRFRLWGTPIQLGPKKVHVYGADQHLWQRIFLEITTRHVVALLPEGTCGNTIHRLVTNVQQYIDPRVSVWVGDQPYKDFIGSAVDQQEERPHERL